MSVCQTNMMKPTADPTEINYDSYYCKHQQLQEYYLSLPKILQDKLDTSDVEVSTLGEMKQIVEYLKTN